MSVDLIPIEDYEADATRQRQRQAGEFCALFSQYDNEEAAKRLGVDSSTLSRWRKESEAFKNGYILARQRLSGERVEIAREVQRFFEYQMPAYAQNLHDLAMSADSEGVRLKANIRLLESGGGLQLKPGQGSPGNTMQQALYLSISGGAPVQVEASTIDGEVKQS